MIYTCVTYLPRRGGGLNVSLRLCADCLVPALAIYLILAVLIVGVMMLLTGRLAPRYPTPAKGRPYESGVSEPISTFTRWPVRYALVGMLFLIFDVEALFFYPWAVVLRNLGWTGVLAVLSFFIVLGVGYVYARQRGALEWR
ncbi:MAG: NADH-quinone oxidoreductase subunit A [Chloroflexi bacterium]|nr:NADH-quinone oxidoreductase subunit A [Chloroflexota bacterium]MBV9543911.1 NADH-quinone oxidoreductase subunit A [Chloroflexota bacterium]